MLKHVINELEKGEKTIRENASNVKVSVKKVKSTIAFLKMEGMVTRRNNKWVLTKTHVYNARGGNKDRKTLSNRGTKVICPGDCIWSGKYRPIIIFLPKTDLKEVFSAFITPLIMQPIRLRQHEHFTLNLRSETRSFPFSSNGYLDFIETGERKDVKKKIGLDGGDRSLYEAGFSDWVRNPFIPSFASDNPWVEILCSKRPQM